MSSDRTARTKRWREGRGEALWVAAARAALRQNAEAAKRSGLSGSGVIPAGSKHVSLQQTHPGQGGREGKTRRHEVRSCRRNVRPLRAALFHPPRWARAVDPGSSP